MRGCVGLRIPIFILILQPRNPGAGGLNLWSPALCRDRKRLPAVPRPILTCGWLGASGCFGASNGLSASLFDMETIRQVF